MLSGQDSRWCWGGFTAAIFCMRLTFSFCGVCIDIELHSGCILKYILYNVYWFPIFHCEIWTSLPSSAASLSSGLKCHCLLVPNCSCSLVDWTPRSSKFFSRLARGSWRNCSLKSIGSLPSTASTRTQWVFTPESVQIFLDRQKWDPWILQHPLSHHLCHLILQLIYELPAPWLVRLL